MSGHERDPELQSAQQGQQEIDPDELAERIGAALEPTMADISERLAEAVTQRLSDLEGTSDLEESGDSTVLDESPAVNEPDDSDKTEQPDDSSEDSVRSQKRAEDRSQSPQPAADSGSGDSAGGGGGGDDSNGESWFGRASSSLWSSFVGELKDEGGEQLEELVDTSVSMLFSKRAKGWVRELADQTLQATLHDALESIDDPADRYQLYRDSLTRLRPVVREAVDSMYTEDTRQVLRHQLRGAIPSLLHGEFGTAFATIVDAISDVTDHAESTVWEHSTEVLQVLQQISAELLQEHAEQAAEEKIDPQEIQEKMQSKAEEARERVQDLAGRLQEGAQAAKERFNGGRDRTAGRGRQGSPPSGLPPHGFPPSGVPPSGKPPSGHPPHGFPPSGLPPAIERRRKSSGSNR